MRVNDALSFMERGFHPLCAASYGIPLSRAKYGPPEERNRQRRGNIERFGALRRLWS